MKESLYESGVECMLCKKHFKTKKSKSKIYQLKGINRELRNTYDLPHINFEPFYYQVHVCEHCGFTFNEKFSPYFIPKLKDDLILLLSKSWKTRSFNMERTPEKALEIYKLAYLMATRKNETAYITASLVLKIAWIYDDLNDEANALKYRQLAYDYYSKSYQNGDYEKYNQSVHFLDYILGTLAYKLGDIQKALYFFYCSCER